MKRILALAIAAMLLLSGCGGKENKGDTNQTTANQTAAHITLKGVGLVLGAELTDDMLEKLGEPTEKTESPNCVYDGVVYDYIYDTFTLQVNQQEDKNTLLMVTITDSAYTTDKGVKIGDSLKTVKEAYGAAQDEKKYYIVYAEDGFDITFNLSGGVVSDIVYEAVN